ncbi:hypothetical protein [Mucilaginibacter gilvus]|uniref:Uncharacterized protein n=1 Tax=Mucilaginibacter gilvus TaxID=2305909 RepID=A0A3S3X0K1_9SPHI|nr:hypothetical protein [Mucilaginibacter gilvus]RWY47896.1 hypothetical protein EPL05_20090 [Mucilaginibacter gilvus]
MNWIIRKTKKMQYHTDLSVILNPIHDYVADFNWLFSDLDFMSGEVTPFNFEDEYFLLTGEEMLQILTKHIQFVWGVIIAIPYNVEITIDENAIPFAEGNELIWKNGNLQHPDAAIEIICFDSGYTIVKFTDERLSAKFKAYFGDEAIELGKFT